MTGHRVVPVSRSTRYRPVFAGEYPGRRQYINAGSRAEVELTDEVTTPSGFTLSAMVFATTPRAGRQGLCGTWATDHAGQARGASLILQDGCPALIFAVDGRTEVVSSGIPVAAHRWQQVTLSHDPSAGSVTFVVGAPQGHPLESGLARVCTLLVPAIDGGGRLFTIAALRDDSDGPEGFADWAVAHFNGKLDRVRWLGAPAEPDVVAGPTPPADVEVLGWWDFGREIDSERIIDLGPAQRHGRTRNLPARAATGHNWDGSAHRWVDAPEQYGAIHFHTDDVHDAGWEPSFEYRVPDDLPSGVYAARLTNADGAYRIPFFVRAGAGQQRADIVFVASTATYLAYGNGVQTTELIHAALRDDRFLDEVYLTLKEHPEFDVRGTTSTPTAPRAATCPGCGPWSMFSPGFPRRGRSRPTPWCSPGWNAVGTPSTWSPTTTWRRWVPRRWPGIAW
ncbi:MAG: LamG domain-containing protein [Propionibacterium sp.]|nr:LamG domain-containing protein [Propionibacterium sp.]